jgi:uncharacterized membrane protein YhfC
VDIRFLAHLLNGLLMIAMPVGLAIYLTRKFHLGWDLWWVGAAVFIFSQVGHIPFNYLMTILLNRTRLVNLPATGRLFFNAVFLGLSAGLWEESFRYGMYRWWVMDARSWRKGLLVGAGHGGAEAIALGLSVLYSFIQMAALRNANLTRLFPAPQLPQAVQQVSAYWSATWYASLLGALERFFAIPAQIGLSILVLQAFTRKQAIWVWLAVFFHALTDASVVLASHYFGVFWTEALIGLFAIVSVGLIFALHQPDTAPVSHTVLPVSSAPFNPQSVQETWEQIEDTRYQ